MHLSEFLSINRGSVKLAQLWRLLGRGDRDKGPERNTIVALEPTPVGPGDELVKVEVGRTQVRVTVNTPAISGPQSVLPDYFQESLIDGQTQGDTRMATLLGLFDDRYLSLRRLLDRRSPMAIRFEDQVSAGQEGFQHDAVFFSSLAGISQSSIPPQKLVQYLALLSPRSRGLRGMRDMLSDYLGLQVMVSSVFAEPVILSPQSTTRLGARDGQRNSLGGTLMLGTRSVFYFRRLLAVIYVTSRSQFEMLKRDDTLVREVRELIRIYSRSSVPVRVMVSVLREFLSPPVLSSKPALGFRLGQTTVLDPLRVPKARVTPELVNTGS
jgi:predicted component of type VI protein secretion system